MALIKPPGGPDKAARAPGRGAWSNAVFLVPKGTLPPRRVASSFLTRPYFLLALFLLLHLAFLLPSCCFLPSWRSLFLLRSGILAGAAPVLPLLYWPANRSLACCCVAARASRRSPGARPALRDVAPAF